MYTFLIVKLNLDIEQLKEQSYKVQLVSLTFPHITWSSSADVICQVDMNICTFGTSLSQCGKEVLKVLIYNYITTGKTPSADEEYVIWLKAPQHQLSELCGEIHFSIFRSIL